jgi:hypothetical protein
MVAMQSVNTLASRLAKWLLAILVARKLCPIPATNVAMLRKQLLIGDRLDKCRRLLVRLR